VQYCESRAACALRPADRQRQAAQGDAEVAQVRNLLTAKQTETRTLERRVDDLEAEARPGDAT
jgi:hypothetical protein